MKLFPDQIEVKEKLRAALLEHKSVLLVAPTGFGKTTLTADIFSTLKGTAWFVVHRKRLFSDVIDAFTREGIDFGFIAARKPYNPNKRIYICMAKTLANRIHRFSEPDLVVVDEAHNIGAKTYDVISTKGTYRLLLTATPERTDGKGLGAYANHMIQAPDMQWLINNKRLSPYKYYAPSGIDTSQLRKAGGEYTTASIDKLYEKSTITGDCIESYKKYANGKRAVVFAHSIKAAQEVAQAYCAAGIPAASLESSLNSEESDDISNKFKAGELLVVVSVSMILEGYDLPAIECVVWRRPSASLIVVRQGNGRGLRYIPDKTCIILDHVNNFKRHGLPDTPIEWSLEGKKARAAKEATIAVRECEKCKACYAPAEECPECGHINLRRERTVEEIAGELELIKEQQAQEEKIKKQEQGAARTFEELKALAIKRGYKNPTHWAGIIYKARGGR